MNRIKEINFADAVAVVEPGVITGDAPGRGAEAAALSIRPTRRA